MTEHPRPAHHTPDMPAHPADTAHHRGDRDPTAPATALSQATIDDLVRALVGLLAAATETARFWTPLLHQLAAEHPHPAADQPPVDARQRALASRRRRHTGPVPGRRRAPRRIDAHTWPYGWVRTALCHRYRRRH